MEKRHVEFLLWDTKGKAILSELIALQEEINKAYDEAHAIPFGNEEEFDRKSQIAYKLHDKTTPFVEMIESMFYVDEVLDPYDSVSMEFTQLPATASSLLSTIETERLKRHTRKRQPRVVRERAIELGLWDETLVPQIVESNKKAKKK
ncbi:hypothetical protein ACQKGI_15100 [Peribacillus muralis]|uniref:hypothetical protein n=1 Tax=Peribacillus muralis TaxID=264697 RepID=UPI00380C2A0D